MDTDALQRLDAFLSDPKIPQEDKARAVAMARVQEGTPASRSGSYLTNKASQFVGALQGVQKDVTNLVTGEPYGTGFPGQRSALDTIGDVATTAAPIVAPGLTAAGLAAGTLARGGGIDEPTADLINAGTQLGIGGGQAITGLVRGASDAQGLLASRYRALKEAAGQTGARLSPYREAAQDVSGRLTRSLGRFPLGSAERQTAKGLIRQLTPAELPSGIAGTNEALLGGGPTYADLDEALGNVQGLRRTSQIRGAIKQGMNAVLEGTPEAGQRAAIDAPWSRLMGKPILRGTLGGLGRVGSMATAVGAGYRGNYKLAAGLAAGALLGGRSPGQLIAAGKAAAGPLAQTAVGVGANQIAGLATAPDQGYTPKPSLPPDASPASTTTAARGQPPLAALPGPYGREIAAVSSLVGVPAPLIQSVMRQESAGHPGAVSHPAADQAQTPAYGLMQITPGTFATVAPQLRDLLGRKPDLGNPFDNILAGGLLWRQYLDRTNGDVGLAAKMYFGGEGTQAWGPRTQRYSEDISRRFAGTQEAPPSSGWRQNLDQRVRAGYITQEQADAEAGG